jgi:lipopolysaccharide export LptBFGC system permease protein LptF
MIKRKNKIPYFNIVTTVVGLIITSLALWVSIRAINKADKYFEINSRSSESLFSAQLKHSKELNDSIIYQLRKIQEVTDLQNSVARDQLKTSNKILYDQIYANRPIVVVENNAYTDLEDGHFDIKTTLKNVGHRHAYNTVIRMIFVDDSIDQVFYKGFEEFLIIIDPNSQEKYVNANYNPDYHKSIRPLNKDKFFYCVDIRYDDLLLNETFGRTYYYRYDTTLSKEFFTYEKIIEDKLREFINGRFKAEKMKLLYE